MTTAICFSKQRAAQLDLLLRSIEENAPGMYDRVHVIWKGDGEYAAAYRICAGEHEWAEFVDEVDLREQTLRLVTAASDHVAFLMDDCVFYRRVSLDSAAESVSVPEGWEVEILGAERDPAAVLEDEDVLCFSPRLGLQTTECYPLRGSQQVPAAHAAQDGVVYWAWRNAQSDFSYWASLDGHVFRKDDLLPMLHDVHDWSTPNTVEAALAQMSDRTDRPLMASHTCSSLVGVPVNRTGDSHVTNRAGEFYPRDPAELNRAYLAGKRIALDSIDRLMVNAAHVEFPLRMA